MSIVDRVAARFAQAAKLAPAEAAKLAAWADKVLLLLQDASLQTREKITELAGHDDAKMLRDVDRSLVEAGKELGRFEVRRSAEAREPR